MGYIAYRKQQEKLAYGKSARKPLKQLEQDLWRPWEGQICNSNKISCRFDDCNVTFKRESELKRHEHSVHQKSRESCTHCLKIFTRKDNLTRHIKMKHRSSTKKPRCEYCHKKLSRQDAVQRHMGNCSRNPQKTIYSLGSFPISIPDVRPVFNNSDSSDSENRC